MTELKLSEVIERLRNVTKELPKGKANQASNYCDKLSVAFKKRAKKIEEDNEAKRKMQKQLVFEALCSGRQLSQLDVRDFCMEDMRTAVSHLRNRATAAGYETHSEWFVSPYGTRMKRYWYEHKN